MRATTLLSIAALFAATLAQTPAGTKPTTDVNLGAEYGSTTVTPSILLPRSLVATQPTVYSNETYPSTYQILLVDHSIPYTSLPSNTTFSTLVRGLGENRTTRLHWWATNMTQQITPQTSNIFTNSTPALAEYGGPQPPLGDSQHYYALYLFPQPSGFAIDVAAAQRNYNPISVEARMNFSVEALAAEVGGPVAATWIRAVNPDVTFANGSSSVNGTAVTTGAGGNGSVGVGVGASGTPVPFTGAAAAAAAGEVSRGMGGVAFVMLGMLGFALF